MDWQLKGGLYIDHNKFYGCTNILDDVVNSFGIGCLQSYKVQESKGSLESVIIWSPVILIVLAINRVIEE